MSDATTEANAPTNESKLSLKSLNDRMLDLEGVISSMEVAGVDELMVRFEQELSNREALFSEAVREMMRMLVYFAEYALWNEGRDRHAGPKPSGKIAELRRLTDGMRKRMANGFTTNARTDPANADQPDSETVQPVRNGDPA